MPLLPLLPIAFYFLFLTHYSPQDYDVILSMESIVGSKDKLHFFEYLEVDLMQGYLRTGINYFVNAILNTHDALIPLRYYHREITALIDFLKDLLSLHTHAGTYAENFFGLTRGKMGRWGALRGAFVWAILPYIGGRLDDAYNEVVGEQLEGARLSIYRKVLKQVYPYIYACFGLIQTFYRFRYLYLQDGKDHHYHLLYRAEDLHLSRLPSQPEAKYPILELLKKPGLLMVLAGHKVLNWYFSQKREKRTGRGGNEGNSTVPALFPEEKITDNGKCSICTGSLRNATMVRQTGYVYCWECIEAYVRKEGRCPLGGLEVAPEQLQILYD